MNLPHLAARVKRLEALSMGLSREALFISTADAPLLYVERQAHLDALREAVSAVESARLALAKARRRLRQ